MGKNSRSATAKVVGAHVKGPWTSRHGENEEILKMRTIALTASAGCLCAMAGLAHAEPLAPPAGPVAGTGATQIFELPFSINQPGSYRLARDVTSPGGNGITINVSNVTLDLGGHTMNGGGVGVEGVLLTGNLEGVTVQNGTITNWSNAAIFDGFSADTGVVIREIRATNLGLEGLRLSESDALVIECVVTNAVGPGAGGAAPEGGALSGQGIWVGNNSRIVDCKVVNAGDEGILAGSNAVITGCIVDGATFLEGAAGIAAANNAIIENCVVTNSASGGFAAGQQSNLSNCTATNNFGAVAATSGTVDRRKGEIVPLYEPAAPSIDGRTGQPIMDVAHALLTTEGFGAAEGFLVGDGSRIDNCIADFNSGTGFLLSNNSYITNSVANNNGGDGVSVVNDNVVNENRASVNSGNGFVIGSNGNHVEGNYASANSVDGFLINGGFEVVIRNHVELDNINNVGGSALVGPINDLTSPTSNWAQ